MENEKLIEKIGQVLKKSRGEPSKFIELITCIRDLNQEGEIASNPKVVRKLWPLDWKQAKDKVECEKSKWDILRKRRREINERVFDSQMCFNFFIELSQEKQFHIISDPKQIYSKRVEELERNLARAKSETIKEKIKTPIIELNDKFKEFAKRESGELSEDQQPVFELPDKPSIAVLPFTNISGDREQEYFSDGVTDELINALAKLKGLKVISRTSAFYFKGKDVDLRTVGEKLKVKNVLEGSVRKSGNKLRITAQLIKVADDTHLWAETYDREMEDVFAIQEEISCEIVGVLKVQLMGKTDTQVVKRTTENMEAFELYLKAKSTPWNLRETDDVVLLYEKVIEFDPDFAPAYVELAEKLALGPLPPMSLQDEDFLKAKAYIEKALKLDYTNAKAHATLANAKIANWDWDGAEKEFKRAIELSPGSSFPHSVYARYLGEMGHYDEQLIESMKGMELDPLDGIAVFEYGKALINSGQFDKAKQHCEKTIEIFPYHRGLKFILVRTYELNGMYDEAIEIFRKVGFQFGIIRTYAQMGKREDAQKMLDELNTEQGINLIQNACFYSILGEKDKAIEFLEQAVVEHLPQCVWMIAHPDFDNLRSDPRFIVLLKKMGIES